MMVCMTFIFSACMRIIRASFLGVEDDHHDSLFGLGLTNPPLRRENGLTRFEIDALGQIQFIKNSKDGSCNDTMDSCSDIESSSTPCLMSIPLQPNLECSICLIEFNENDRCRQLPCDHIFHTTCIDQWFGVSVLCPMCKRNIRSILVGDDDLPVRPSTTPPQQQQLSSSSSSPQSHSHSQQLQNQRQTLSTNSINFSDFTTTGSPMTIGIELLDINHNQNNNNINNNHNNDNNYNGSERSSSGDSNAHLISTPTNIHINENEAESVSLINR